MTSICPQYGYQNKPEVLYAKHVQQRYTLNFQKLSFLTKPFVKRKKKLGLLISKGQITNLLPIR
jgi:hypothetical protein